MINEMANLSANRTERSGGSEEPVDPVRAEYPKESGGIWRSYRFPL